MLYTENLTIEYAGGRRAVSDVSFTLGAGESVALIGANGAGKTTLLLALAGVLSSGSGGVFIDGAALNKKSAQEFRTKIGFVFQDPDDQLFMPNVYEDVAFGPKNCGLNAEKSAERAERALDLLKIDYLRDRSPLRMSGGEKRLAAIATVLSMQPEYLLFDEPTAYLDPRARRNLLAIIEGLPQGKLIATHDLAFASAACARALILKGGAIIADGPIDCLKDAALMDLAGL